MKLTRQQLDSIRRNYQECKDYEPSFVTPSKAWKRMDEKQVLEQIGDIDFSLIRPVGSCLDCYIGGVWAYSITYKDGSYYVRKTGLRGATFLGGIMRNAPFTIGGIISIFVILTLAMILVFLSPPTVLQIIILAFIPLFIVALLILHTRGRAKMP